MAARPSKQCVNGTTLPVQPGAASDMGAVEYVLKSPEHSSAEYGAPGATAFKTSGSRLCTSYAPKEAAVDTSDGLVKTGFGPTVFLPPRLLVSRSKGPDARSKVGEGTQGLAQPSPTLISTLTLPLP